jgi:hypothetical protein
MFGGTKKKLERLVAAIAAAREVIERGAAVDAAEAAVHAELKSAYDDTPPNELDADARALLKQLRDRALSEAEVIPVEEIPPCRACGGIELLRTVSQGHAVVFVAHQRAHVPLEIFVCCACGEMRFVADPKLVASVRTQEDAKAFRRVDAKEPPSEGPFR